MDILKVNPPIEEPSAPANLPEAVHRAFLAGARTMPTDGLEEASAGAFGRALDVGTKIYAPELSNLTLYHRIEKLADLHRITPNLKDWAHEIRLIRNDALHANDGVTREELIAIRGFTEMVLTYLFTLPGMLAARKADAGNATPPPGAVGTSM